MVFDILFHPLPQALGDIIAPVGNHRHGAPPEQPLGHGTCKHVLDVAILDLKMEDMDGIEVLKIFNQMDLDMKIIMLTGHGSQEAAREGLRIGAFDYLTKPCELDDLIDKINEAYANRS